MARIRGGKQRGDKKTIRMVSSFRCKAQITKRSGEVVERRQYCDVCGRTAAIEAERVRQSIITETKKKEADKAEEDRKRLIVFRARCKERDRLFQEGATNEFKDVPNNVEVITLTPEDRKVLEDAN